LAKADKKSGNSKQADLKEYIALEVHVSDKEKSRFEELTIPTHIGRFQASIKITQAPEPDPWLELSRI
jgi:hypothetical protein